MKNSLDKIEEISEQCHMYTTIYTYNQKIKKDDKYNKGRVKSALWINELCYYYIQKEKLFIKEFKTTLVNQKTQLEKLPNNSYKSGLIDQINSILKEFIKK